jgi:hypothetical protein
MLPQYLRMLYVIAMKYLQLQAHTMFWNVLSGIQYLFPVVADAGCVMETFSDGGAKYIGRWYEGHLFLVSDAISVHP